MRLKTLTKWDHFGFLSNNAAELVNVTSDVILKISLFHCGFECRGICRTPSAFGKETLDVIEESVKGLREVDGIGRKRVSIISRAGSDQEEILEVMVFLQGHGVSAGYYRGLATTISWCLLRRRCVKRRA
jgi:hypothetical protein